MRCTGPRTSAAVLVGATVVLTGRGSSASSSPAAPPAVQKAALQRVQDLMPRYKTTPAPFDLDKALFVP